MNKIIPMIISCMLLGSPTISLNNSGFLVENNKVSNVSIKSNGSNFQEDIEIVVETAGNELVFSPEHNEGYDPSLFIGNFLDNGLDQLLYSVNSGGSGGYSYYQLFSLKNNEIKELFNSDDFNPLISASYIENDIIEIDYQGKKLYIDSSFSGCESKEDCSLYISSVSAIFPYYNIDLDRYYLQVLQRIYGGFSANNYGYILSLLSISEDGYNVINIGTLSNFEYPN